MNFDTQITHDALALVSSASLKYEDIVDVNMSTNLGVLFDKLYVQGVPWFQAIFTNKRFYFVYNRHDTGITFRGVNKFTEAILTYMIDGNVDTMSSVTIGYGLFEAPGVHKGLFEITGPLMTPVDIMNADFVYEHGGGIDVKLDSKFLLNYVDGKTVNGKLEIFRKYDALKTKLNYSGIEKVVSLTAEVWPIRKYTLIVRENNENKDLIFFNNVSLKPFTMTHKTQRKTASVVVDVEGKDYQLWWNKNNDEGVRLQYSVKDSFFEKCKLSTPFRVIEVEYLDESSNTDKIIISTERKNDENSKLKVSLRFIEKPETKQVEIESNHLKSGPICVERINDPRGTYQAGAIHLTDCDNAYIPGALLALAYKRYDDTSEVLFKSADVFYGAKLVNTTGSERTLYTNSSNFNTMLEIKHVAGSKLYLKGDNIEFNFNSYPIENGIHKMNMLLNVNDKKTAYFNMNAVTDFYSPKMNAEIESVRGTGYMSFRRRTPYTLMSRIYTKAVSGNEKEYFNYDIGFDTMNMFRANLTADEDFITDIMMYGSRLLDTNHIVSLMNNGMASVKSGVNEAGSAFAAKLSTNLDNKAVADYMQKHLEDLDAYQVMTKDLWDNDDYFLKTMFEPIMQIKDDVKISERIKTLWNKMTQFYSKTDFGSRWINEKVTTLINKIKDILSVKLNLKDFQFILKRSIQWIVKTKESFEKTLEEVSDASIKFTDRVRTKMDSLQRTKFAIEEYAKDLYIGLRDLLLKNPDIKEFVDTLPTAESLRQKLTFLYNKVSEEYGETSEIWSSLRRGDLKKAFDIYFKPELFRLMVKKESFGYTMETYVPYTIQYISKASFDTVIRKIKQGSTVESPLNFVVNILQNFKYYKSMLTGKPMDTLNFVKSGEAKILFRTGEIKTFNDAWMTYPTKNSYSVLLLKDYVTNHLAMKMDVDNGKWIIYIRYQENEFTVNDKFIVKRLDKPISQPKYEKAYVGTVLIFRRPDSNEQVIYTTYEPNCEKCAIEITLNDHFKTMDIVVGGNYFNNLNGMLGSNNYENSDDYIGPDRQAACDKQRTCIAPWKIKGEVKASIEASIPKERNNFNETNLTRVCRYCEAILNGRESTLVQCNSAIDSEPYKNTCCGLTYEHRNKLTNLASAQIKRRACDFGATYEKSCKRAGVHVYAPNICKYNEASSEVKKSITLLIEMNDCVKRRMGEINQFIDSVDTTTEGSAQFSAILFNNQGYSKSVVVENKPKIFEFSGTDLKNRLDELLILDTAETRNSFLQMQGNGKAVEALENLLRMNEASIKTSTAVLFTCSKCTENKDLSIANLLRRMKKFGISIHQIPDAATRENSEPSTRLVGIDSTSRVYQLNQETSKVEVVRRGNDVIFPQDVCYTFTRSEDGGFWPFQPLTDTEDNVKIIMGKIVEMIRK